MTHATISVNSLAVKGRLGNTEATCESRESVETNTSRIQNAHFSGFFDSDGCINVFYQENAYGGISYGCEVKIGASEPHKLLLLENMQAVFGGHTHSNGKTIHLSFRIGEAEPMLKALYPFLILKKPQASLWFKFREVLKQRRADVGYRHKLRQQLVERIRGMHASAQGPVGRLRPDWSRTETNAYAAGLVDGDGSIGMYRSTTVRLLGKAKTLPEWLQNAFGGTLRTAVNHQRGVCYWEWAKYGTEAEDFLTLIAPYSFRMKIGSGHAGNCVACPGDLAGTNAVAETNCPFSTSAMTSF